ncbi:MAG TPA: mannose-1-phosphate guanylyltransferase [Candidatus Acidoferrales bacterium]|nr:mannose-1-phosphate guanylyltransferase [Candidatus Acidoferrales bacterium]
MSQNPDRSLPFCAVLLAGGRGTRFWPRSRIGTPKQLLHIVGRQTMLSQTMARLESLIPARNVWVVTNRDQAACVRHELRRLPRANILAEPVGRNTAAAIGLAAFHLAREHGDALMAVLPSDHWIRQVGRYRTLVRAAFELARTPGNLVVLGVPPTRPETGYGYIEQGNAGGRPLGIAAFGVRRFREKPALRQARNYVRSGRYFWNAGMFLWRVSTLLENLNRFLPATYKALAEISKTIGSRRYGSVLKHIYPRLENISVDYAILEPATRMAGRPRVYVIPARIGWSDIGSWGAVYELEAQRSGENVSAGPVFALDATGNYFWSPKKLVAAVGVRDLVLVETDDALLLCSRDRSQDVGKIVEWLEATGRRKLL